MRKLLFFSLIVCLLFPFSVSADRNVQTIKGFSVSQLIKRGDAKVYSIDFIATGAGGEFTLHDVDDLSDISIIDGSTTIKAEGREATANNGKFYDFTNKPLEFSNGLYLRVVSATVVIRYE